MLAIRNLDLGCSFKFSMVICLMIRSDRQGCAVWLQDTLFRGYCDPIPSMCISEKFFLASNLVNYNSLLKSKILLDL